MVDYVGLAACFGGRVISLLSNEYIGHCKSYHIRV